jgi:prevent-host-death family protein
MKILNLSRCYRVTHMAEQVGVRELRQNLSKYLRRIKRGESLIVTERGQKVARIVPLERSEYREMLVELYGATLPGGSEKLSHTIKRLNVEGRLGPPSPAGTTDAFLDESRKDLG